MTKKQKDLLQVNAFVSFLFSSLCVVAGIQLLIYPKSINEAFKNLPKNVAQPSEVIINGAIVFIILGTILFAHIIWTYLLIRKNKEYFEA